MLELPLYPTGLNSIIHTGEELDRDALCCRCHHCGTARSVCIPADGTPGGLFVVGKMPGINEDMIGRVNVGDSGNLLRSVISQHWNGPVVLDNAIKCYPGDRAITPAQIAACRPYLRRVLREASPTRILALGAEACQALLGRSIPIMSVRRGYTYVIPPDSDRLVPVFMVVHPAAALRNPFVRRIFEKDMAYALRRTDITEPPLRATYYLIETEVDAHRAVAEIREEAPWFAYDVETGGMPYSDYFEIVTVAVCPSGTDTAWVWERSALSDPKIRSPLLNLLADPSIGKVGHNLKYDNNSIRAAYGVEVMGSHGDTWLQRRILEADVDGRLEVGVELIGMGGMKGENDAALEIACATIARERNSLAHNQMSLAIGGDPAISAACQYNDEDPKRFAYVIVPSNIRQRYCARDAVGTSRLGDLLERRLGRTQELQLVWDGIVSGAVEAVSQIEHWGIAASYTSISSFDTYVSAELERVRRELTSYGNFNPSSPQEVASFIYDTLKLPIIQTNDGAGSRSTKQEILLALRSKHPAIDHLIEHRRLEKYRSNYGLTMASYIRGDGRIHPTLKIAGTKTGRFACVDPALHGIPSATTDLGRMVKCAFVAPIGKKIIQLDYSQIELRIAAMLSGDPVMIAMFHSGEDFHTATAKLIAREYWGIEPDQVGKEERRSSKAYNFGLLYGMTDGGLAHRLGCTKAQAAQLRALIMGKWKWLALWMDEQVAFARRTGYCRTWWNGSYARLRPLINIRSDDPKKRSRAENSAKNTPVQGTASDFMAVSIVELVRWIIRDFIPAKICLTVHDSVIAEVDTEAVDEFICGAIEIMTSHNSMGVPLRVDVEVGDSWGDLSTYKV